MWDINLKTTNEQIRQTNRNSQSQATVWQLREGKGGQTNADTRSDFGW